MNDVERVFDFNGGEKIDEFTKNLECIKEKIMTGANIHTAVVSLHISDAIKAIGMSYTSL